MIYLFRKLFGKSKIKFLGRAGLIFIFDGTEYFIDSEMLAGKVDIVIYTSTVTLRSNSNIILDNALKEKVIKVLV